MLTGLSITEIALCTVAGVLLDLLLGEPKRWHPLVGFGRWSGKLEGLLNQGGWRRARGVFAWLLAVLPPTALAWLVIGHVGHIERAFGLPGAYLLHGLLLYFCIGLRSLRDHALPIAHALIRGDLAQARMLTGRIVSRDTAQAEPADLAKAGAESLLENGNDAVFGTLFWFVVAGGPGALLFRLANTLDAMWGYRNARFLLFGWAAARIDDVLNWVPARLTALSYVLLASTIDDKRRAWRCWRSQAASWSSPNAGPVMASGAGALGLALGGVAVYDGVAEQRPVLGGGRAARAEDVERAWHLVACTATMWVALIVLAGILALGRT